MSIDYVAREVDIEVLSSLIFMKIGGLAVGRVCSCDRENMKLE